VWNDLRWKDTRKASRETRIHGGKKKKHVSKQRRNEEMLGGKRQERVAIFKGGAVGVEKRKGDQTAGR